MQNKPSFFLKFLSFSFLSLTFVFIFLLVKPYANIKAAPPYIPSGGGANFCGNGCQQGYACSCPEWDFDWDNNVPGPAGCSCIKKPDDQQACIHTICPVNYYCYAPDGADSEIPGDGDASYCLPNENTPPPGGGGGQDTPTPIPLSLSCLDVKAYTPTFVLHTPATLSALRAGNTVNFCVRGSTNSGTFTSARFTINGVLRPVTTTTRPGTTNEFCDLYTVPANTFNFAVSGQVQHSTGVVVD